MGRTVGVLAAVLTCAGIAHAGGPTRKVLVESDPPGATVFVNEKELGPACSPTPCSADVPVGDAAVLFVELANYAEEFKEITVPAKGKPLKVHVDLKPAVGTLVISGAPGAEVEVEGEDKGKSPARIELPEGGYHVVVKLSGKTLYDDFVQIDSGNESPVAVRATGGGGAPEPTDPPETEPGVAKPAAPAGKPRGRYVRASGAFDIGFRKFSYDNNQTTKTLRDETEAGQVLAGPMLEVWPTEIAGVGVLTGLSLMARFEFGVNSQAVTGMDIMGPTTTSWRSFEISLRNRWVIAGKGAVEVGAGYVDDTYRFNGAPSDVMLVPDADYESVRLGARGSLLIDAFEPYLVLENRIVIDGGAIGKRFALGASANGLHGALGVAASFGPVSARLEAGITDYSWTFKPDAGAVFVASGGSDRIEQISLSIGYAY